MPRKSRLQILQKELAQSPKSEEEYDLSEFYDDPSQYDEPPDTKEETDGY